MDDRRHAAGNGGAEQNPAYRPTHPLKPLTCGYVAVRRGRFANSPKEGQERARPGGVSPFPSGAAAAVGVQRPTDPGMGQSRVDGLDRLAVADEQQGVLCRSSWEADVGRKAPVFECLAERRIGCIRGEGQLPLDGALDAHYCPLWIGTCLHNRRPSRGPAGAPAIAGPFDRRYAEQELFALLLRWLRGLNPGAYQIALRTGLPGVVQDLCLGGSARFGTCRPPSVATPYEKSRGPTPARFRVGGLPPFRAGWARDQFEEARQPTAHNR